MPYALQIPLMPFEQILQLKPNERLLEIFDFLSPLAHPLLKELEGTFEGKRGPDGYSCRALLFALIAMFTEKISNRAKLVERLKGDPRFAWVCGFDPFGPTPSEATFSRFFRDLSETPLLLELFQDFVKKGCEMGHIGNEAAAVDGSHIHAYVTPPKPLKKKEKEALSPPQAKTREEESSAASCSSGHSPHPINSVNDLPTEPAWGAKRNPQGNVFYWYGYKIHIVLDTKSELPVAFRVVSANIHDKTVFLPLLKDLMETSPGVRFKYYIADEAYDSQDIYTILRNEFEAQAIIPLNTRGAKEPPPGFDFNGTPVCTAGLQMVYWGSDGERNKFRCPEAAGKCRCPLQIECSDSPYGLTVHCTIDDDPRRFSHPHRGTRHYEELKRKRSAVERFNGRAKVHLKMDSLTVQGFSKVTAHMALMCIAMIAGTLAQVKTQEKADAVVLPKVA